MPSHVVRQGLTLASDKPDNRVAFDEERFPIVAQFAALPEEAFGYFCGFMHSMSVTAGGFKKESRAAVEAFGPLVRAYFDLKTKKPGADPAE